MMVNIHSVMLLR